MPDQALRAILEGVIEREPLLAAEALEAVQLGSDGAPFNFDGLKAAAGFVGQTPQHFIVQGLANRSLLKAFALSLSIRKAVLPEGWEAALDEVSETRVVDLDATERPPAEDEVAASDEDEDEDVEAAEADGDEEDDALVRTTVSDEARAQFERLVKATRCRIRVDGRPVGSGFLVGPSTVLTAWHVIRDAEPPANARVDVDFADGSRVPAVLPARFNSPCGTRELQNLFPQNDNEVDGKHDIALLRLRRPVGAALGSVQIAAPDSRLRTNDMMILVHYPEATYAGLSYGIFSKLRALTARWGHSVKAKGGSSGGGCFNSGLLLAGIHQGRAPKGKSARAPRSRLVPANRFPGQVRQMIAEDQAPPQLWSLDGTASGPLVVGRQDFFTAFAAANGPVSRVRGIRIKRVDAEAGVTGLPFSYRMLEYLIGRTVDLRLLRISLQTVIEDFTDEVVRRARLAGYDIDAVAGEPGVEADQTTLEAAASDRARRAAILLDGLAAAGGARLWIFLDHPSAVFGDSLRASFEGFVDQVLKLNNLRIVVAGYEAMSVPGQEFRYAYEAEDDGAPGMMTEFLDGFRRSDVVHLIGLAAKELGVTVTDDLVSYIADGALGGMVEIGGVYEPKLAGVLIDALRPELLRLAQRQPVRRGQGNG